MSGKHTVKIDVGAGGTEKRPLIHPRTDTDTPALSLSLSSSSSLLLVASTYGQKDLGGMLVLVKTSVMLVPVSIYLRKDSVLGSGGRKSGEKIHWAKEGERRVLRGRKQRSGASMIRRWVERDGVSLTLPIPCHLPRASSS